MHPFYWREVTEKASRNKGEVVAHCDPEIMKPNATNPMSMMNAHTSSSAAVVGAMSPYLRRLCVLSDLIHPSRTPEITPSLPRNFASIAQQSIHLGHVFIHKVSSK